MAPENIDMFHSGLAPLSLCYDEVRLPPRAYRGRQLTDICRALSSILCHHPDWTLTVVALRTSVERLNPDIRHSIDRQVPIGWINGDIAREELCADPIITSARGR